MNDGIRGSLTKPSKQKHSKIIFTITKDFKSKNVPKSSQDSNLQGCCREANSYHTSKTHNSAAAGVEVVCLSYLKFYAYTENQHESTRLSIVKSHEHWWTLHDSVLCLSNWTVTCRSPTCQFSAKLQAANAKFMSHLKAMCNSSKIIQSILLKLPETQNEKSQTWSENMWKYA